METVEISKELVEEARGSLLEQGYARLRGVFDGETVERARELVDRCWQEDMANENKPPMAAETPMVWNLQAKDPFFLDMLFSARELHAVLVRTLNDPWYRPIPKDEPNYILRNFVARSSDRVRLPMHIDSFIPYRGEHPISVTCSLVLDESSMENGCTMVIPGSHQSGTFAEQSGLDAAIPLEASAGDIAFWDSRIWHGAHPNLSGRTRWALNATFTCWWIKQAFDIPRSLPQEIYERLTPSQRAVLGFASIPFRDESVGIDFRLGYDDLADDVRTYRG